MRPHTLHICFALAYLLGCHGAAYTKLVKTSQKIICEYFSGQTKTLLAVFIDGERNDIFESIAANNECQISFQIQSSNLTWHNRSNLVEHHNYILVVKNYQSFRLANEYFSIHSNKMIDLNCFSVDCLNI